MILVLLSCPHSIQQHPVSVKIRGLWTIRVVYTNKWKLGDLASLSFRYLIFRDYLTCFLLASRDTVSYETIFLVCCIL